MENQLDDVASAGELLPKVTGVGGIFFFAENPKEMKDWYAKNLGFEFND